MGILAGFALEHLDSGVLHDECVGGAAAAAAVSTARVGAASSVLVGASVLHLYCGLIVELRFKIVCCGLGRGSCGMWCAVVLLLLPAFVLCRPTRKSSGTRCPGAT